MLYFNFKMVYKKELIYLFLLSAVVQVQATSSTSTQILSADKPQYLPDIAKNILPAVNCVRAIYGNKEKRGTGVFIDSLGHVVTCAHVIEGTSSVRVALLEQVLEARVIAANNERDVAILQVDVCSIAAPWAFVSLSKMLPNIGTSIVAFGFPNGKLTLRYGKMTGGYKTLITPPRRKILVPIDGLIQPGYSGGPVMDAYGELVGIVSCSSWGAYPSGHKQIGSEESNIVPSCVIQKTLSQSIEGFLEPPTTLLRPSSWVTLKNAKVKVVALTPEQAVERNLSGPVEGLMVVEAMPGLLAEGDIVLRVNGQKICSLENLYGAIQLGIHSMEWRHWDNLKKAWYKREIWPESK